MWPSAARSNAGRANRGMSPGGTIYPGETGSRIHDPPSAPYGNVSDMSASDGIYGDLPEMILRLAGEAGQVSLARSADAAGARASVDQHASEIRDALTR